jgi:hypothetical protein
MFQRLSIEAWMIVFPIVAFCVMFVFFAVASVRAILMEQSRRDRLAALPLDDDNRPAGKP